MKDTDANSENIFGKSEKKVGELKETTDNKSEYIADTHVTGMEKAWAELLKTNWAHLSPAMDNLLRAGKDVDEEKKELLKKK